MLRSCLLMTFYRTLFSFFILILLGACSHLKESCLQINWHEVGRQDSTLGLNFKKSLSKRQKTCSIEKDSVYTKAYQNGFLSGLREYCNFKTGYSYGFSKLKDNFKACSKTSHFSQGFQSGIYMSEIQSLQKELTERISRIQKQITKKEQPASPDKEL